MNLQMYGLDAYSQIFISASSDHSDIHIGDHNDSGQHFAVKTSGDKFNHKMILRIAVLEAYSQIFIRASSDYSDIHKGYHNDSGQSFAVKTFGDKFNHKIIIR